MKYTILGAMLLSFAATGNSESTTSVPGDFFVDNDTVLLLKMDEGQGEPQDASGNGNHGKQQFKSFIPEWTVGRFKRPGHALDFGTDGTTRFLSLTDAPTLNGFEQVTLEAWIYPLKPQGAGWLLCKGGTKIPPSYSMHIATDGELVMELRGVGKVTAPGAIEFGQWQNVAGTYDGSYLRLFVNGKMVSVSPGRKGASVEINDSALFIGIYGGTGKTYAYDGLVEQVRISRVARYTPGEARVMPGALVTAVRTNASPVIDGRLDETAWSYAAIAGNFIRNVTHESASAQTRVFLMYDDKNIYLGFSCEEPYLDPVKNLLHTFKADKTEADTNVWVDDSVEIFIYTSGDAIDYYHIVVNSLGTVYSACGSDKRWFPKTQAAGSRTDSAWYAEISIPFADMGLDGPPGTSDVWRLNLCRNRRPNENECYTSWSPVGVEGFHSPASFGYLGFADSPIVVREVDYGTIKAGNNIVSAKVSNLSSLPEEVTLRLMTEYGEDKITYFDTQTIPAHGESVINLKYFIDAGNRCLRFEASNTGTVSAHTSHMNVKADTNYYFSAMVKVEESTFPPSYPLFRIQGTDINYETAGTVDTTRQDWQRVTGIWRSPAMDADVRLWLVGWKGHGRGVFLVDDVMLVEEGTNRNIIPNSTFPAGAELAGWPVVMKGGAVDSYGAGMGVFSYTTQIVSRGGTIYQSPQFSYRIERPLRTINSSIAHLSAEGSRGIETYNLSEIHIATGTMERVILILKSPKPEALEDVFFEIEVPQFVRLITEDFPYREYISPLDWKEELFERAGVAYRRYIFRFNQNAVTNYYGYPHELLPIPLLLHVMERPVDYRKTYDISYGSWEAGKERESPQLLSLKILPPLYGRKPKSLPLVMWGPSTPTIKAHSMKVQKMLLYQWSTAFNQITSKGSDELDTFAVKREMKPFPQLPTITISRHFPSAKKYLEKYPEHRDRSASGNTVDSICFAHLLENNSEYLKEVKEIITRWVNQFPHHVHWDYEFAVTAPNSSGYSERNIKLFQERYNIRSDKALEIAEVLDKYRDKWVDFRCRQNAQFAALYRKYIKEANSDTLYSMYSGYPPAASERYGVDWKYMGEHVDLVMCGYGRGTPDRVYEDIGKRYWNAGELVWGGWYNLNNFHNIIFQRLTDAGSFMTYTDWVIDGRFLYAVSRAAAVAADFEDFFLHIDKANELARCAEGKALRDVTVLTHKGERLLFAFNTGPVEKKLEIVNINLPDGMMAVDWETGRQFDTPHKIIALVPPRGVQVIYIANANSIAPARLKSAGCNIEAALAQEIVVDQPVRTGNDSKEKIGYWTEGYISSFSEVAKDYSVRRNGEYSYRMFNPEFDTGIIYYASVRTNSHRGPTGTKLPRVKQGQKWAFSLWAKIKGGISVTARVDFLDEQGRRLPGSMQAIRGCADWQKLSVIATVPENAANLILSVGLDHYNSGTAWVDDFDLQLLQSNDYRQMN